MELNEEVVKKSLDWLDSLVGNSNDSNIALLTYQLLGILYDTCEELTEENERLRIRYVSADNLIISETVRKMQKKLCEGRVSNDPVVIAVNVTVNEMLEGL